MNEEQRLIVKDGLSALKSINNEIVKIQNTISIMQHEQSKIQNALLIILNEGVKN